MTLSVDNHTTVRLHHHSPLVLLLCLMSPNLSLKDLQIKKPATNNDESQ
jgi:hypothetical protein